MTDGWTDGRTTKTMTKTESEMDGQKLPAYTFVARVINVAKCYIHIYVY